MPDDDDVDPFAGPAWSDESAVTVRPDGTVIGRSGRRRMSTRTRRRLRRQRRWGRILVLLGCGLVLLTGVYLFVTAIQARQELQHVRNDLAALRADAATGNTAGLDLVAQDLVAHARRASDLTNLPLWDVVSAVPWLGRPFESVQGMSAATSTLAEQAVPTLIDLTTRLTPERLRAADGRIDLRAIAASGPAIVRSLRAAVEARSAVRELPTATWFGPVDDARQSLASSLQGLVGTLDAARRTVQVLPAMLGQGGTRRYFVGFLNEAELRGTGGLPGAFAIVRVADGKITTERFESDTFLINARTGLDFGPDYRALYGSSRSTDVYVNSTLSPDFPTVARIWTGMWRVTTGQRVDGALAVDPTALSYLLAVAGPAPLPGGGFVTAGNVVSLTQRDVYARFPGGPTESQEPRKQFLLGLAKAAERRVTDSAQITGLARAAARAAAERRLLVWSSDPAVEAELAQTGFSGALPSDPYPFAGPVVVNAAGSKLDYYLRRDFSWSSTNCATDRVVTARLSLTNDAPARGLSRYVTARLDSPEHAPRPGDNHVLLQYYATTGAQLLSATVDGSPVRLGQFHEKGHPVYVGDVELPVGSTRVIEIRYRETGPWAPVDVLDQPGVVAQRVTVHPSC